MSGSDDYYQAKVDECRQKAARAFSPSDEKAWLRLANAWLALIRSQSQKMTLMRFK
jgi:hypothetical protein